MAVSPQHFTEVEGLRVQFRIRGQGEPLLLLHGWGGSSVTFTSVTHRLEERFRLLIPDLPGFGFSEPPSEAWGAAEYARVVAGLVVASGFGAAHVAGHSFGGLVAVALARSRPELVKSVVLVASPVVRLRRRSRVRLRSLAFSAARRAANLVPPLKPRIVDWARMRFGSTDYRQAGPLRPTLVRIVTEDWRDALPSLQMPVQLIYGEKDDDVPLETAHAARELLPGEAPLVVVPGAGHFPFLDDADAFVEALTGFLLPAEAPADA